MNRSTRLLGITGLSLLLIGMVTPGCNNHDAAPQEENATATDIAPADQGAVEEAPPATQSSDVSEGEGATGQAETVFQTILDGNESVAIALVEQGTPVNAKDHRDVSLLHFAVRASMLDLTRTLLEAGADPNARISANAQTPVHWVSRIGAQDRDHAVEILDLLLDHGGEINVEDVDGTTPIDYALQLDNRQWLEILLQRGARLN